MTFTNIIKDEIRGNLHTYKEYFLATAFSAGLIFMSLLIICHPGIQMDSLSANFVMAAKVVDFIIGIFFFIFIFYSQYTFLKHRSRDYAMFSILGMRQRQLTLLNFWESFTVFTSGVVSGMLVSLLFSRLIFLAFSKLLDIDDIGMYLPWQPALITLFIFALIFVVIQISATIIIRRTEVKSFLQFGQKSQKMKKVNIPIAILSLLVIIAGYYLSASSTSDNILGRIIPVSMMVIIGMYFFYRELCPFLLMLLEKRKSFYYRGVNMLWVSDLRYRIADFTIMLFLISTTMSVGLTGFSAVFNIANAEIINGPMMQSRYPMAVLTPTQGDDDTMNSVNSDSSAVARIERMFASHNIEYSSFDISVYSTGERGSDIVLKESELHYFLSGDELASVSMEGKDTMRLDKKGYQLEIYLPFRNVFVVKDSELHKHFDGFVVNNLKVYEFKTFKNLGREIFSIDADVQNSHSREMIFSASMFKYFYFIARRIYLLLSFYFVIVFYISAFCMLYFKFFNNVTEEGVKYRNYSKVGLSLKELKRSSTIQMAVIFFLPGLITILNMSMAMLALIDKTSPDSFLRITTYIILFTILIQVLYFMFIRNRYLKKIC